MPRDVNVEVGAVLAAERTYADRTQSAGMSQARLAGLIGISAEQVGRIEKGVAVIDVREVRKWEVACDAPFRVMTAPPDPQMDAIRSQLDRIETAVGPAPVPASPPEHVYHLDRGRITAPTFNRIGLAIHTGRWNLIAAGKTPPEIQDVPESEVVAWFAAPDDVAMRQQIAAYVAGHPAS